MKKILTLTIGIPTCYGGETLVKTAESIAAAIQALRSARPEIIDRVQFIIVADRTPIAPVVLAKLEKFGASVKWNAKEGSQLKKIEQLIHMADGDIFVSTQDDVVFAADTLLRIVESFEKDDSLTMLGVRVLPATADSFFGSVLSTMMRVVDTVSRNWNNGDNHLSASGRCLAYRTEFIKQFRTPHEIINCDMFFYLENRRLKGKFVASNNARVYIRTPKNIKEQTGASSRYQYSQQELSKYFDYDIGNEYNLSITALFAGFLKELFIHPVGTVAYVFVYLYTRLKKQPKRVVSNTKWKIDKSTKT